MSNRLVNKFVAKWIERFAPSLLSERDFNIETGFDTQKHLKKGVFMETVIIINMYICVFVSLIYAII